MGRFEWMTACRHTTTDNKKIILKTMKKKNVDKQILCVSLQKFRNEINNPLMF